MVRIAVLFTGQDRNLARNIKLLRRNLLEANSVTLFLACESGWPDFMRHFDGLEVGGADVRSESFRNSEELNLFNQILHRSDRPALRDAVYARSVPEGWNTYYVTEGSGTITQYYQVWKAWMLLLAYEQKNNMKFDVVARCRPDSIIGDRLDLSTLLSSDELTCRSLGSEKIRSKLTLAGGSTENAVVTLGYEQFWVARRDVFALLGPMLFTYGCWDHGEKYAFNSESNFIAFCKMNHLTYWAFPVANMFNMNHPGGGEVLDDPDVFSLLR
jgi:hypothetical protein